MDVETIKFGGLSFSLYETKEKTWKIYTRLGRTPHVFHRKFKEDAINAAKAFAEGNVKPLPDKVTFQRKEAELFHEAARILEPFNITVADAARFYANANRGLLESVKIQEAAEQFLQAKAVDEKSPVYLKSLKYHGSCLD